MREILFRGKRVDNDEWIEGYYLKNGNTDCFVEYSDVVTPVPIIPVVSETVGQYTNMLDKNGKKIFEGDILEVDVFKNLNRYKAVWTVEYKERFSQGNGYYFYGKNRRFNTRATQSTIINTHATVIGNIYDNPELLGDEENDSNDT